MAFTSSLSVLPPSVDQGWQNVLPGGVPHVVSTRSINPSSSANCRELLQHGAPESCRGAWSLVRGSGRRMGRHDALLRVVGRYQTCLMMCFNAHSPATP